uniref:Uncharacterized protein n=1 Tax=viral metagenome TaxID=1070528 RepID=A0A6M3JUS8_9ZZZZ
MAFVSVVNTGFYNLLKLWPETWTANTAYAIGDVVKKTTYNSHSYLCTVAGTSHASTEPTWSTTNGVTQTDGTVTWKVFDPKTYQIKAPQSSTVPYVTFGLMTESPMGTFQDFEKMESLTYWVNAFSKISTADVAEITDEVMTALDDTTLTVTGYTNMKCVREFIGSPIWDIETDIFMIPLRYRVWLSKD